MKRIKIVFELIFIFILPLVLLACCFNVKKEYDVNGNEINKELVFNNVFHLDNSYEENSITYNVASLYYEEEDLDYLDNVYIKIIDKTYFRIDWQTHEANNLVDYDYRDYFFGQFNLVESNPIIIRVASSLISRRNSIYVYRDDDWDIYSFYYLEYNDNVYLKNDIPASLALNSFIQTLPEIMNDYWNSQPELEELTITITYLEEIINENAISKVINYLYSSLGIQENYILQIIVIYTLLWLIMWFIWHLIYLPLDFLSQILIRRVDYAKD